MYDANLEAGMNCTVYDHHMRGERGEGGASRNIPCVALLSLYPLPSLTVSLSGTCVCLVCLLYNTTTILCMYIRKHIWGAVLVV